MSRLALFALLGLLAVSTVHAHRQLQQFPVQEGCSASPGTQRPPECQNGFLGIGGQQWDKDELECALPNGYQLKCDHNQETFGSNTVRCNIDQGPLSSEIKFECPVDPNCQINCDWAEVAGRLPGAVLEPTRRIMAAWKPQEDIFG